MPNITPTPALTPEAWQERVVAVVNVDDNGCWNWPQTLMPNGYGRISVGNGRHYVHRVAFTSTKGPIPRGLHIDHLCRNRGCCNPDHLEAVTQRVNNLRSESFAAHKAKQTECVNGHDLDAGNTYMAPNGTRKCRTCRRINNRAAYYRATAKAARMAVSA